MAHVGLVVMLLLVVAAIGGVGAYVTSKNVSHADNCIDKPFEQQGGTSSKFCNQTVQQLLVYRGIRDGTAGASSGSLLVVDGQFGARTKQAVINFQKTKGLTADGIVGLNTWTKLCYTADIPAGATRDAYSKAANATGVGCATLNSSTSSSTSTSTTTTKETPPTPTGLKAFGSAYYSDNLRFAPGALDMHYNDGTEYEFVFQTDGNLVHYKNGKALWASGTYGQVGSGGYLLLRLDCSMAIYSLTNKLLWSTPGISGSPTKCGLWAIQNVSVVGRVGNGTDTTLWRQQ